jgi:hypothetical protein
MLLPLLLFPLVIIQYLQSGDTTQISRLFHLYLYSFVGAFFLAALSQDLRIALFAYLSAVSIQAVIILIAFFSIELRQAIGDVVYIGANYGVDYMYRAPGFTSSAGSDLSVIQSMGIVAGIGFLKLTFGRRNVWLTLLVILLIGVCWASTIFVGRTGLLVGTAFIFMYLLSVQKNFSFKHVKYLIALLVAGSAAAAAGMNLLLNFDNFDPDYFLNWAFGSYFGEGSAVEELGSMPIPPLSEDTLIGTGLVVDPMTGESATGHDSGYIQAYYSMGVILATVFYSFLMYILLRASKGRDWILWLLIATLFVIELKEPFVFKYNVILLIMLFSRFEIAENSWPRVWVGNMERPNVSKEI